MIRDTPVLYINKKIFHDLFDVYKMARGRIKDVKWSYSVLRDRSSGPDGPRSQITCDAAGPGEDRHRSYISVFFLILDFNGLIPDFNSLIRIGQRV